MERGRISPQCRTCRRLSGHAICGALLFSGYRHIVIFGMTNVVVVIALATLLAGGFISLWCVYAAVSAGAVGLHLRYAKARRPPLAGTTSPPAG